MAIITIAARKLARLTNRRDARLWTISAALAVVTAATGAEIAPLFIAAGLLMIAALGEMIHAAERAHQLTSGLALEQLQAEQLRSESLLRKSSLPGREHSSHRAHRVSASP